MSKGKFYGVSVGPGDPELITLKAVRVLENIQIIATPRTQGESTLALDIVSQVVDMAGKEVLTLDFLMSRDKEKVHQRHVEIAQTIVQKLDTGEDVAMLNLGDVSVFSTFSYIMEIVQANGYEVEVIPGVTSFCAVAGKLKVSLTSMNEPLHILPASTIEEAIELPGTKVIMKAGKSMDEVKRILTQRGVDVKGVQNCGLPNEKICHNAGDLSNELGYFTTLIVK